MLRQVVAKKTSGSEVETLKTHNFSQPTDSCCREKLNSQHQSDKLADGMGK